LNFIPEYPPLFTLTGIVALSSGIYFLFQRQILKNIGFLMLSGYLIWISLAYFFIVDIKIYETFSIITAIFALAAAIFFIRGK